MSSYRLIYLRCFLDHGRLSLSDGELSKGRQNLPIRLQSGSVHCAVPRWDVAHCETRSTRYQLPGLICCTFEVGLLPKGNEEQIPFAYSQYKDSSEDGVEKALGFKKAFSRHIIIDFMGVWYVSWLY